MSQQLVKKGTNGKHENVMPKSWIEAIKDKSTGQTLVEILQGFNMYFLSYNGNTSATRCLVPTILRKKGLWITYVKYDGNVYTEWYAADKIDDTSWGDSSNWRVGNNTLVGDITISANGNWVINGTETEFKAIGEKGNTPLIRVANNRLQVSYDLGDTYIDVTNNPVYTKFRWLATTGDTQANNVGRIQASTDEGKTWTNMSNDFTNNLHIKKYIGVNESLPTSGIAEGTIYAKGPYYAEDDTLNDNPIYRMWIYAWKGSTLAWQDNGEFTSISAGVVQETGDSETEVMSQKAVSTKLSELGQDVSERLSKNMSIVLNGSYVQFELKEVISRNVYGSYIFLVNFKDITNNQVVFTIGNNDNKIYLQLINDVVKLHYIDGNGNRVTSGLSYVNLGWNKLCLKIREGNVAGPVLELIVNDSNYALSTQSFQWDEINYAVVTLGALNSGLLPTNASFAALLSSINGNNVNYYANHFANNINGNYQLESCGITIPDMAKYPYSLPLKKDELFMRFNGSTSFLTFENKQGIVTTEGIIHFKCKVPTDIQTNQILFAWGNQLMVTLNEGYLQFYNRESQSLSFPMQIYIGKVITLSLIKSNSNLDVLIDGVKVTSKAISVDATEDIQTLSIGSYDGGSALFSALDFYEIIKTDLYNNIEWVINPFTKPSTMKDLTVYIGGVAIGENGTKKDYFANLPNNIYITNGLQYNMYIENIIHGYEKLGYQLEVKTSAADRTIHSMDRCVRFEVSKTGAKEALFTLFDAQGNVLQSENRNIVATNCYAGSGTKQFLFCGDSTIDDATTGLYEHEGPEIVRQFYNNCIDFKGFVPTMIGTKKNFPPYYHEGNTGQASSWYVSSSSPFYIGGKLDFKAYMDKAGASGNIDFFVYQIGINDLKNEGSPTSVINNIKTLISVLLTDYPNCKVIVGIPPSGCSADGWSHSFADAARYEIFRNNMIEYQKLLIDNFADGVYSDNVFICNAGHFIDRKYGFPHENRAVSARIDDTVFTHIDSVHPNKGGYDQMADAYFAIVKALV